MNDALWEKRKVRRKFTWTIEYDQDFVTPFKMLEEVAQLLEEEEDTTV